LAFDWLSPLIGNGIILFFHRGNPFSMPIAALFRRLIALFLLAFAVAVTGCSGGPKPPPLGTVHGTVKLDDKPLENATLEFVPVNSRVSSGTTDSKGEYQLTFDTSHKGAAVGEHTVKITTRNPTTSPTEKVPPRYNDQTELKATVKAGDNKVDFDLKTK
jgi:hypothetical protein